ncbi:MAG: DUF1622 domain-containing protein [Chloroflexi bacterium]|nr:DUF1622 domain-containing protein [Chloroflexota bacterium]
MQQIVDYVTLSIGAVAGLIIVYGVIAGLSDLIRVEFRRLKTGEEKPAAFERVRYDIGFHLLLGLEFLIAADIIRTIVKPNLQELAVLGGIVAIRTVLSYFLGKEIDRRK